MSTRKTKQSSFPDADRNRKPLRITMDPDWRQEAQKMADVDGLPLSRWLEQLIRHEFSRREKKATRTP
jgi:hypothetical protein